MGFEFDAWGWVVSKECDFTASIEAYRIAAQPIPAGIEKYLEEEMPEQIMMDGEPLEVGDRVWCLLRGWLKFDGVFHAGVCAYFPLKFTDKNGEQVTYTQAFQIMAGSNRTLYWDEIKIIPPPKPKNKVKVWDWVIYNLVDEPSLVLSARTETDLKEKGYLSYKKVEGTEREVER